ncbi:MAG: hypothetical protein ACTTGJ_03900 [Clostridium sp.]
MDPYLNLNDSDIYVNLEVPFGAIIVSKVFIDKDFIKDKDAFAEMEYIINNRVESNDYTLVKLNLFTKEKIYIPVTEEQIKRLDIDKYLFFDSVILEKFKRFLDKENNIIFEEDNRYSRDIPEEMLLLEKEEGKQRTELNLKKVLPINTTSGILNDLYVLEKNIYNIESKKIESTEVVKFYNILHDEYSQYISILKEEISDIVF